MSIIPVLREAFDDLAFMQPSSLFDDGFGVGLFDEDLTYPLMISSLPLRSKHLRSARRHHHRRHAIKNRKNKDGFKVNVDVQQFQPDEINVKMVDDYVIVEGKHEERQDEHGYISRQFQRRYKIPEDMDRESVVSKLSSDGVLSIEASKKALPEPNGERVIPIMHTNLPAVTAQPTSSKDEKESTENMEQ